LAVRLTTAHPNWTLNEQIVIRQKENFFPVIVTERLCWDKQQTLSPTSFLTLRLLFLAMLELEVPVSIFLNGRYINV